MVFGTTSINGRRRYLPRVRLRGWFETKNGTSSAAVSAVLPQDPLLQDIQAIHQLTFSGVAKARAHQTRYVEFAM